MDMNDLLAQMPHKTSGDTGVIIIPAGKKVSVETSPQGSEYVFGTVPLDKN